MIYDVILFDEVIFEVKAGSKQDAYRIAIAKVKSSDIWYMWKKVNVCRKTS